MTRVSHVVRYRCWGWIRPENLRWRSVALEQQQWRKCRRCARRGVRGRRDSGQFESWIKSWNNCTHFVSILCHFLSQHPKYVVTWIWKIYYFPSTQNIELKIYLSELAAGSVPQAFKHLPCWLCDAQFLWCYFCELTHEMYNTEEHGRVAEHTFGRKLFQFEKSWSSSSEHLYSP